jgi:aminoglycoside 6-adenylyltransferase
MDDEVIRTLVRWATGQNLVRAMLLTSSRAVPGATVDALSDYDVILVVRDIEPLMSDHRWIETFGDVLVAYWDPLETDSDSGYTWSGNIVEYTGALKIDFTFWPADMLHHIMNQPRLPAELDAGYRVLLDKDGLTVALSAPTHTGYIPQPPDEQTFLTLVNDFFIGVPYVAKMLLREEVLPAKWCLDYDMRYVYLLPMLEWRMEIDHGWSLSPGVNGKGLKQRLPPDMWSELEHTYVGMEVEENWDAMFRMIDLFRRAARDVAASLGFTYPEELHQRVTDHAKSMRADGMPRTRPEL